MGSSAGKEGGQRDPGVKKDGRDVLRAGGGGVAAARLRRCLLCVAYSLAVGGRGQEVGEEEGIPLTGKPKGGLFPLLPSC